MSMDENKDNNDPNKPGDGDKGQPDSKQSRLDKLRSEKRASERVLRQSISSFLDTNTTGLHDEAGQDTEINVEEHQITPTEAAELIISLDEERSLEQEQQRQQKTEKQIENDGIFAKKLQEAQLQERAQQQFNKLTEAMKGDIELAVQTQRNLDQEARNLTREEREQAKIAKEQASRLKKQTKTKQNEAVSEDQSVEGYNDELSEQSSVAVDHEKYQEGAQNVKKIIEIIRKDSEELKEQKEKQEKELEEKAQNNQRISEEEYLKTTQGQIESLKEIARTLVNGNNFEEIINEARDIYEQRLEDTNPNRELEETLNSLSRMYEVEGQEYDTEIDNIASKGLFQKAAKKFSDAAGNIAAIEEGKRLDQIEGDLELAKELGGSPSNYSSKDDSIQKEQFKETQYSQKIIPQEASGSLKSPPPESQPSSSGQNPSAIDTSNDEALAIQLQFDENNIEISQQEPSVSNQEALTSNIQPVDTQSSHFDVAGTPLPNYTTNDNVSFLEQVENLTRRREGRAGSRERLLSTIPEAQRPAAGTSTREMNENGILDDTNMESVLRPVYNEYAGAAGLQIQNNEPEPVRTFAIRRQPTSILRSKSRSLSNTNADSRKPAAVSGSNDQSQLLSDSGVRLDVDNSESATERRASDRTQSSNSNNSEDSILKKKYASVSDTENGTIPGAVAMVPYNDEIAAKELENTSPAANEVSDTAAIASETDDIGIGGDDEDIPGPPRLERQSRRIIGGGKGGAGIVQVGRDDGDDITDSSSLKERSTATGEISRKQSDVANYGVPIEAELVTDTETELVTDRDGKPSVIITQSERNTSQGSDARSDVSDATADLIEAVPVPPVLNAKIEKVEPKEEAKEKPKYQLNESGELTVEGVPYKEAPRRERRKYNKGTEQNPQSLVPSSGDYVLRPRTRFGKIKRNVSRTMSGMSGSFKKVFSRSQSSTDNSHDTKDINTKTIDKKNDKKEALPDIDNHSITANPPSTAENTDLSPSAFHSQVNVPTSIEIPNPSVQQDAIDIMRRGSIGSISSISSDDISLNETSSQNIPNNSETTSKDRSKPQSR